MLAWVFAIGGVLSGANGAPPAELTTYESKCYVLETNLPKDRAQFIARVMDATGFEYDRRFKGFRGLVRRHPRIRVFATREQYVAALARVAPAEYAATSGLFCGDDETV